MAPAQTKYLVVWLSKDGLVKMYASDLYLNIETYTSTAINMLDNGSFNNNKAKLGYLGCSGAIPTIVNDSPIDNTSLKIDSSWDGNGVWQQIWPVPARHIRILAGLKSTKSGNGNSNAWIAVSLDYMDANNNYLSTVSHEIYVNNAWVPFQISNIAPEGTAYVNAIAWILDCSSCSLYVDNLSLAASTNGPQLNDYLQVTGVDQVHRVGRSMGRALPSLCWILVSIPMPCARSSSKASIST